MSGLLSLLMVVTTHSAWAIPPLRNLGLALKPGLIPGCSSANDAEAARLLGLSREKWQQEHDDLTTGLYSKDERGRLLADHFTAKFLAALFDATNRPQVFSVGVLYPCRADLLPEPARVDELVGAITSELKQIEDSNVSSASPDERVDIERSAWAWASELQRVRLLVGTMKPTKLQANIARALAAAAGRVTEVQSRLLAARRDEVRLEPSRLRGSSVTDDVAAARVFGLSAAEWRAEIEGVARAIYDEAKAKRDRGEKAEAEREARARADGRPILSRIILNVPVRTSAWMPDPGPRLTPEDHQVQDELSVRVVRRWTRALFAKRPRADEIAGLSVYPKSFFKPTLQLGLREELMKIAVEELGLQPVSQTLFWDQGLFLKLEPGNDYLNVYAKLKEAQTRLYATGEGPLREMMIAYIDDLIRWCDPHAYVAVPRTPDPKDPRAVAVAIALPSDVFVRADRVLVAHVRSLGNPALMAALDTLYAKGDLRVDPRAEGSRKKKAANVAAWREASAMFGRLMTVDWLEGNLREQFPRESSRHFVPRLRELHQKVNQIVSGQCASALAAEREVKERVEAEALRVRIAAEERRARHAVRNVRVETQVHVRRK